ncbi:MAG: alkaline phosphatase D family protein, partial [Armatimonadota bacterium]
MRIPATLVAIFLCVPSLAAELTHGPMLGHTTDTTVRVWVRADGACQLRTRAVPVRGGHAVLSDAVRLTEQDNFCGSARIAGLSPRTTYTYRVLLDGDEQPATLVQQVTTFPRPGEPSIIRIGFGHSLGRSKGEQITWRAVEAQRPHLFILMGDNIYSNSTDPARQRPMYLAFRNDPHFRAFASHTPIYAIYDDHDYGTDNSDRTQPGKERSLKTFNELWPNPPSQAVGAPGIWTRFTVGGAEFFLMDVRYHRSPDEDPDGPDKTMLGAEQRRWLVESLAASRAIFKFPVSGSSWHCGGQEAWNHPFAYEYDAILKQIAAKRVPGIILLGGDQHACKINVRPGHTWGGYDLHEWMASRIWNGGPESRGFGIITVDTETSPPAARLAFIDEEGNPKYGRRVPYTRPGDT